MMRFLGISIRNQRIPVLGLESFFTLRTCLRNNRTKPGTDLLAKLVPIDVRGTRQCPEHDIEAGGIRSELRGQCTHSSLDEIALHGIANGLGNDKTKTVIALGFFRTNPCI